MVADGVIDNYAVADAIGAMFYVEPFSTEDLDLFVLTPKDRLIIELPGWEYLKTRGYTELRKEGIVVEGWPVQFMPVKNALEHEAYLNAQQLDLEGISVCSALSRQSARQIEPDALRARLRFALRRNRVD